MNYGRALRVARSVVGWTTDELARRIGRDTEYVERLEAGNRAPALRVRATILQTLGVPEQVFEMLAGNYSKKALPYDLMVATGDLLRWVCPSIEDPDNPPRKPRTPRNAFAPKVKQLPGPTRAQQRARKEFVRASGIKIDPERIKRISDQWKR